MADGKIYITISDKRLGEPKEPKKPGEENEKREDKKNAYIQHEMLHFLKDQASQMVNYTIGHIGFYTGNNTVQERIAFLKGSANVAKSIGVAAIAGFQVGGIYGAAIGAGVSTFSLATNFGLKSMTEIVDYNRQLRETRILRSISGLDGLTNGSR